jgi:hypothetical protein
MGSYFVDKEVLKRETVSKYASSEFNTETGIGLEGVGGWYKEKILTPTPYSCYCL